MGQVTEKIAAMPDRMSDTQKGVMVAQREVMLITQVAKMRDDFQWLCAFWGTFGTVLIAGAVKLKKPPMLIPLIPGGFACSYMYDGAYGNKFDRIRKNAEEIFADKNGDRVKFGQLPRGNRLMSPEEYLERVIRGHPQKRS